MSNHVYIKRLKERKAMSQLNWINIAPPAHGIPFADVSIFLTEPCFSFFLFLFTLFITKVEFHVI